MYIIGFSSPARELFGVVNTVETDDTVQTCTTGRSNVRTRRLLNLYDRLNGASLSEPPTGGIVHVRVYACLLACLLTWREDDSC